jgi:hypothetical protein
MFKPVAEDRSATHAVASSDEKACLSTHLPRGPCGGTVVLVLDRSSVSFTPGSSTKASIEPNLVGNFTNILPVRLGHRLL